MKSLVIFALLFAANSAPAFSTRWVCATDPLSTSYSLIENENGFELQFVHHNGIEFLPVHEGLITAADLQEIGRKAKILAKTGARGSIFFAKSDCTINGHEWTCTLAGQSRIGNLDVQDMQLAIRERRLVTRLGDWPGFALDLSFSVDGEGLRIPMIYDASDCVFH